MPKQIRIESLDVLKAMKQKEAEEKVIGYYSDYSLECVACVSEGEPATAEALPDGFTCDSCGVVVNA